MITAHYANRLPENYDLGRIRALTKERAAVWDARPDLYFKAFLLRETARFGAIANNFSSLYLWRHDGAYRDWLVSGGYKIITDRFGRGEIEARFALDARKGPGHEARFAYTEELDIPLDADLSAAFAREIERNREIAAQPTRSPPLSARIRGTGNSPASGFQRTSRTGIRTQSPTRSFIWRGPSSIRFRRQTIDELSDDRRRACLRRAA